MSGSALRRWAASWRVSLVMARADARRHRARTLLATCLVALPVAGILAAGAVLLGSPPPTQAALRGLPDGAQAVVTGVALPGPAPLIPQRPEGAPAGLIPDPDAEPPTADELLAALPVGSRLTPFWTSAALLAAPVAIDPFAAGTPAPEQVMTLRLREAEAPLLERMVRAAEGTLPARPGEAAVSRDVATRLGLRVGSPLTIVGPPPTGWMGVEGAVAQLVGGESRTFTVTAVTDGGTDLVWTTPGWLSQAVAAKPQGINRSYVVDGPEPVTWDLVRELNVSRAYAVSRHVLTHYPAPSQLYPAGPSVQEAATLTVVVALGGTTATALLLFLVTPAFAVSAEQSRRVLALAAAAGATPADLRRTVHAQGVVVGLLGGAAGTVVGLGLGLGVGAWRWPGEQVAGSYPWWLVLPCLMGAVGTGLVAALPPARRVARHDVVRSLIGAPEPLSAAADRWVWAGPVLLVLAVACGAWSLALPEPIGVNSPLATHGPGEVDLLLGARVVLTLALGLAGALLTLPLGFQVAARLGRDLPVGARLALGDAVRHPRRAYPAAAAVLVCLVVATALPIGRDSSQADHHDRFPGFAAPGHLVAGPSVPVSEAFDKAAIGQVVPLVEAVAGPVRRHEIRSWDGRRSTLPVVAPVRTCPDATMTPTLASTLSVAAPLTCDHHRYERGFATAWWLGEDRVVMTGDALRASGRPEAEAAAAVLDRGGVVVSSANDLTADGYATVSRGVADDAVGWRFDPETAIRFEAGLVPVFGPTLVLSPQAAQRLGLSDHIYVGEYLQTRPLSPLDEMRILAGVEHRTTLVTVSSWRLGEDMVVTVVWSLLVSGVAVAAAAISLALARTQSQQDVTTMVAVGATPGWVRRHTLVQAGVLLGVAVPAGVLLGLGAGVYVVRFGGALGPGYWRRVMVPWPELLAVWGLVVAGGLTAAWLLGRRPVPLVRRHLD